MIKFLRMENFGPVCGMRELDFNGAGTTSITGSNGIGKTHVTAAIKFLLTGKLDKPLYTYVHGFGLKGVMQAVVEGYFNLHGKDVQVRRTLTISSTISEEEIENKMLSGETIKTVAKATLKTEGTTMRSITEVNSTLLELTGLDSQIRMSSIFVDQNRAGAILHETPAELQRSLQALSGASVCQKAVDAAQALLPQFAAIDRSKEVEDLRNKLAVISVEMEEVEEEIARKEKAIAELPDMKELTDKIYKAESVLEQESTLQTLREDFALLTEEYVNLTSDTEGQLKEIYETIRDPEVQDKVKQARDYVAGADSKKALLKQKHNLEANLEALQAEAEARISAYEQLQKPPCNLDDLRVRYNAAAEELNKANNFLKVFAETGSCPTCGSVPANADMLIAENRVVEAKLRPEVDRLGAEIRGAELEVKEYESAITTYKAWESSFTQRLDSAQAALDEVQGVEEINEQELKDKKDFITEYEDMEKLARKLEAADEKVKEKKAKIEQSRIEKQARIDSITLDSSALIPADEVESMKEVVQQHLNLQSGRSSKQGELEAKKKEYSRVEAELDVLIKLQQEAKDKLRKKAVLEGVKTVMHRTALPHDIASLYVVDINNRLANYCELLKLPFVLFIHPETLAFMAVVEGLTCSVSQLSGGQQTMAAWAWHLSLYEKHGRSFGMLIMDEPTTGVDEANMENIAEAISHMESYCAGANIQLMVITHENILAPYFNSTVELN